MYSRLAARSCGCVYLCRGLWGSLQPAKVVYAVGAAFVLHSQHREVNRCSGGCVFTKSIASMLHEEIDGGFAERRGSQAAMALGSCRRRGAGECGRQIKVAG